MQRYLTQSIVALLLLLIGQGLALRDGEMEAIDISMVQQLAGAFEGDIILTDYENRNGIIGSRYRWPNGRIPYTIAANAQYNVYEMEVLYNAMEQYRRYTCLRWEPRQSTDRNYANIYSGGGCSSNIGMQGGVQQLSLMRTNAQGSTCMISGIAQHEMMHCAGFYHEQSRTDRDGYVTIYYENIQTGYAHNFDACSAIQCDPLGTSYDYGSIMHYDNLSFSRDPTNNLYTILPTQANAEIGQRKGLSYVDVYKLNTLYGCTVPINVPSAIDQSSNPSACNFDADWCGWIQDYKVVLDPNTSDPYLQYADEFDYLRISGRTPSGGTGPNGDHTSGSGRYIYAETSYPTDTGERARIRTPIIPATGAVCISFWYSMYANNTSMMGTLNVYTRPVDTGVAELKWSRSGVMEPNNEGWVQAKISATQNGPFQVLFEAIKGLDYQSDIAIDDFLTTNGAC